MIPDNYAKHEGYEKGAESYNADLQQTKFLGLNWWNFSNFGSKFSGV